MRFHRFGTLSIASTDASKDDVVEKLLNDMGEELAGTHNENRLRLGHVIGVRDDGYTYWETVRAAAAAAADPGTPFAAAATTASGEGISQ